MSNELNDPELIRIIDQNMFSEIFYEKVVFCPLSCPLGEGQSKMTIMTVMTMYSPWGDMSVIIVITVITVIR